MSTTSVEATALITGAFLSGMYAGMMFQVVA